jgi:hypothetical protein
MNKNITISRKQITCGPFQPICLSIGDNVIVTISDEKPHILEFDDALFRYNSTVLLPEGQEEANRKKCDNIPRTGISLISSTLDFLKKNKKKIFVTGHTDTCGTEASNIELSHYRAQCVWAAIRGDRDLFKEVANAPHLQNKEKKHQTLIFDQIQIANWASDAFGWSCGHVQNGSNYLTTFKKFQENYNNHSFAENTSGIALDPDGDWGPNTWGAVYDCYQLQVAQNLKINRSQLDSYRSGIDWDACSLKKPEPTAKCGEFHPVDAPGQDSHRSKTNRRVVVYFFDANEGSGVACVAGVCNEKNCTLHKRDVSPVIPIPPVAESGFTAMRIRLHDKKSQIVTGTDYTFTAGSNVFRGTSDSEGWATVLIPESQCFEKITLEWKANNTLLKRDMIVDCTSGDEITNAKTQLFNIGYHSDISFDEALVLFQSDYGIAEEGLLNGKLPPLTKNKLSQIYTQECCATKPGSV